MIRGARALPALAAFALGLVHAASFAPLTHWTLALAALAGLFLLARDARPLAQAGLAFAFGLGWFGAGLAWLYVSMHIYGGMPAPMAAAAVVLFAAYLSLYPALATGIAARVGGHLAPLARAAALAGAWTVAEIARGWVLTGFPWLGIGYAQLDGPLDRLAPVLGVYGIGLAATAVAALVAAAVPSRRSSRMASGGSYVGAPRAASASGSTVAVLVAILVLVAPLPIPRDAWTTPSGAPLDVRLVQGNVAQDMKFRPERVVAAMQDYAAQFEAGRAPLTILPETAWTVPWERTPEPIARRLLEHVERGHALAIGLPVIIEPAGETTGSRVANSVLMLQPGRAPDPSRPAQRYDKHHLVPFGEFVPWGFRWFVDMMHIPLGDFARGVDQRPFDVADQRIAFNICYEDLFGEEIRIALLGERGATILANVSNIAWFGHSHALPQHLAIARMRTLETARPMVRATNTGMTAAIDDRGRVIASLAPYTAGSLDARVQGTTGLTPFARFGNLPAIATALVLLAASAFAGRGGRRGQSR